MKILVVSTWFPYPLAQGSKIRAYYLIRALAENHKITLCSFEDIPIQLEAVEHMRRFCDRVEIIHRNPFQLTRIKTLLGWFSPEPSSVYAGYSVEMQNMVSHLVTEEEPDLVLAFTFITAPYILNINNAKKVIDIDNFMSRYFGEEVKRAPSIIKRLRNWMTWWKFNRFEEKLINQADLCLAVSNSDRQAIEDTFAVPPGKIEVIPNGVDYVKSKSVECTPNPKQLIFNGSITYKANYDALNFFLAEIFPLILQKIPDVKLLVTGRLEGIDIAQFPDTSHVVFTGYLEDIYEIVASSWVCVVPLRIGAGTRLKILEAMALRTPVVTTTKGSEGLNVETGKEILISDTPEDFANSVVRILLSSQLRETIASNAQDKVRNEYDWQNIGGHLQEIIENLT